MPYNDDVDDPIVKTWMLRFGAAVRAARRDAGLSQETLADRGLVPQSFVSRLEAGIIPYTTLARVARFSIGLEGRIPMGPCPHGHQCAWSDPLITPREYDAYHRRRLLMRHGIIDPRELAALTALEEPRSAPRPDLRPVESAGTLRA